MYYGGGTAYNTTGYNFQHRRMNLEQQKKHVEKLLKKCGPPKPGQIWYAIDSDWYMRFNETDEKPGTIDNTALWDQERKGMKYDVEEKAHYELLPAEVFKFLNMYYKAAPVLKFEVKKDASNNAVVDLYPAYFEIQVEEAEKDSESENQEDAGEEEQDSGKEEEMPNEKESDKEEGEEKPADDAEVEKSLEENKEKEAKKPAKIHMLTMSRYSKLGKLKGSIARLLSLRPQQLTIFVQESGEDSTNFKALDELSEEELSRQIYETLIDIGKKVWKVKCIKTEIDESALNAHEAFSRREPKVGQRVDAKLQDRWLEAEIVEVLEPKPKSGSQEAVPRVKVHYLSFDSSKDKIFDVTSEDIDVAYAHLADWRQQTRKGLKVEINKSVYSMSNDWVEAEIVKIDRKGVSTLKSLYAKQLASRHTKKSEKSLLKKIKGFFVKSKPQEPRTRKSKSGAVRDRSDTVDSDDLEISHLGLVQVEIRVPVQQMYSTVYRQAKRYVVDLGSQDIAVSGTHLQKKKTTHFASLTSKDVSKKPKAPGAVGLRNLGNTCYMNSILQCLMGTEPMTQYFLSGAYEKDINRKNVIGFGGRVAIAYGKLVKKYFSNSYSVIAPSEFKRVFGGCCTTFAGTSQQDSQEFLTQLLDALHEDLNKVLDKPAVEAPDSDGRPDEELAKISWDNHLARNKSLFVDHMFGLLKSHLTCPNEKCKNEATKFDPFSNLVLPIPVKDEYIMNIIFVTLKPRPVRVTIKANEKSKEEVHEILEEGYVPGDDEDIRYTRHFRFNYLVKGEKLYGTRCATWLAERIGVPAEKVSLHSFKSNSIMKCINDPLSDEMFFVRVNDKMQFIAFETNDVDYPELKEIYQQKFIRAKKYYGMFTKTENSTTTTPKEDEKEEPKDESAKKEVEEEKGKVASEEDEAKAQGNTKDLETSKGAEEKTEEKTKDEAKKPEVTPDKKEKAKTGDKKMSDEKPGSDKKDSSEEEEEEEENERFVMLTFQFKKLGAAYYGATVKHEEAFLFDTEKTTFTDIFKAAWERVVDIIDLNHSKLKLKEEFKDPVEAELAVARKAIKILYDKEEIVPADDTYLKLKKPKYAFQLSAARTIKVYLRSTDIFKKEIKSTVSSTYHYYKKQTIEEMDKSLNVGFVAHTPSIGEFESKKEIVTLEKCFKALNTPEKLQNEMDWWYCNKCKNHVPATKKMDVYSAGDILIIVLKRFKAGAALIRRKIEEPVYFPLKDLDLTDYIKGDGNSKIYDLYGVSYHSGGLGGGHYTAKVLVGEQWFSFNDSTVQACTEEDVVNRYAYVLFYKRKDTI